VLTWLEPYWLSALSILATAVGLGFLLFIHEFGHYFVAKRAGVKVEVFSMGICHFLLTWTRRGTVYALSWMPLGGYVRMAGQQDLAPPPGHKPLPHEYGAKKPWVRMAIIVAGVTMNFIAGYLCFAAAFMWGREDVPPVVGKLSAEDSPRVREALEAWVELRMRVLRIRPGAEAVFTVDHGAKAPEGRPQVEDIRLTTFEGESRGLSVAVPSSLPAQPQQEIVLHPGFVAERRLVIHGIRKQLAEFPDWERAFRAGDEIETVGGAPCLSLNDMQKALDASGGSPLEVGVCDQQGRPRKLSVAVSPAYRLGIHSNLDSPRATASAVDAGSGAAEAGICAGDELYLGREARLIKPQDFLTLGRKSRGQPIVFTVVSPDGSRRVAEVCPKQDGYFLDPGQTGLEPTAFPWGNTLIVREVLRGSSAEAKGLEKRAIIMEIGSGVDPDSSPVTLVWAGGGKEYGPHRLQPFPAGPELKIPRPLVEVIHKKPAAAFRGAWAETRETLLATTIIIKKMMSGRTGTSALSGPIVIVKMAYNQAQQGLGQFLWLLGLMGVSLAFFNLLPIPVLDGGHLVFLIYEAVFRKTPSPRVVEYAQYAGLLIILGLFVLVFKNDITRVFLSR
jgi:regulator of sigma E protease